MERVVNIVFAGTGGYGIITAADICAHVAMLTGFDVKKSGLKGIAQRGGPVISHVKFGTLVFSPRVEPGTADFVVNIMGNKVITPFLKGEGLLIDMSEKSIAKYGKCTNMYALGILSHYLPFMEDTWLAAINERFPDGVSAENSHIFLEGAKGAIDPSLIEIVKSFPACSRQEGRLLHL